MLGSVGQPDRYGSLRISPDGMRIATGLANAVASRGVASHPQPKERFRLTAKWIAFTSDESGASTRSMLRTFRPQVPGGEFPPTEEVSRVGAATAKSYSTEHSTEL